MFKFQIFCFIFSIYIFSISSFLRQDLSLAKPYHNLFHTPEGWTTKGNAIVSEDSVILVSDSQSQRGSIWLKKPIQYLNWRIDIEFRITGISNRAYGDGFAFWYVKQRSLEGPVFGSHDYFTGLGVIFDTYCNHYDTHQHKHPYVSAQVNNGQLHYDHDSDGTHSQLDGCSYNFRGKDILASIVYYGSNKTLMVSMKEAHSNEDFTKCFTSTNVELPTGYFIGLSAATGDLSDNHEIIALRFHDKDDLFKEYNFQDYLNVIPNAQKTEPPREHKNGPPASSKGWRIFKRIMLMILILILSGIVIFGVLMLVNKRQKDKMKRFY